MFVSAIAYIRSQFLDRNYNANKHVYAHVTCATNRDLVDKVFKDVQHIVVNASLQRGGLLGPMNPRKEIAETTNRASATNVRSEFEKKEDI